METGRNSLQYIYLMAWWHHNCVTSNVTKVYFIELKINIGRLHCVQEKTHFCFDYNSGVSWSIFILFILVKTELNTLHYPNCVSTLPNRKTAHFEMTVTDRFLQCVPSNRLSNHRKLSTVPLLLIVWKQKLYVILHQSSGRKSSHFHRFCRFGQDFIFKGMV